MRVVAKYRPRILMFQPSLEEFFMIPTPLYLTCPDTLSFVSTLSWGILYDSCLKADGKVLKNKKGFNPLLRNSLWFRNWLGRGGSHYERFQPSLEEFFMIQKLIYEEKYSNDINVSTLSWGILYDSTLLYIFCVVVWVLSFNPLLRNSLWFASMLTANKDVSATFQPSLEEFFMILVEKDEHVVYFYRWFQPSLEEFFMIL